MFKTVTAGLLVTMSTFGNAFAQVPHSVSSGEEAAALMRFETGVIARMERGQVNPAHHTIEERLAYHEVPGAVVAIIRNGDIWAILSHTAGFNVHGFQDYEPGEALPTAIQTLNGSLPAKNDPVEVNFAPGSGFAYSGGGVIVSQVLVEDVTGLSYEEAARRYVFDPLGMTRSTFANPLPASHGDIARAHDEHGAPAGLPRGWEAMPELAASGLWTSARDLALLVIALNESVRDEGTFLPQSLARDMMTRVPGSWHGLGPRLNGAGETRDFHHGGANNSYRAWIEGHLATGDGLVVLTNGTDGHWIYSELRQSAEDAFGWAIRSDGGFEEPEG